MKNKQKLTFRNKNSLLQWSYGIYLWTFKTQTYFGPVKKTFTNDLIFLLIKLIRINHPAQMKKLNFRETQKSNVQFAIFSILLVKNFHVWNAHFWTERTYQKFEMKISALSQTRRHNRNGRNQKFQASRIFDTIYDNSWEKMCVETKILMWRYIRDSVVDSKTLISSSNPEPYISKSLVTFQMSSLLFMIS